MNWAPCEIHVQICSSDRHAHRLHYVRNPSKLATCIYVERDLPPLTIVEADASTTELKPTEIWWIWAFCAMHGAPDSTIRSEVFSWEKDMAGDIQIPPVTQAGLSISMSIWSLEGHVHILCYEHDLWMDWPTLCYGLRRKRVDCQGHEVDWNSLYRVANHTDRLIARRAIRTPIKNCVQRPKNTRLYIKGVILLIGVIWVGSLLFRCNLSYF